MSSDTIQDTKVEWNDVELLLSEKLGLVCETGPNRQATLIGAETGFFSHLFLLDPDWKSPTDSLPNKLVLKVFAKITDFFKEEGGSPDNVARIQQLLEPHNAEVLAYNLFTKYGDNQLNVPKVYGGRCISSVDYAKPFILMEYLENSHPSHILESNTIDEMIQVLSTLVSMNKVTRSLSEEEKKKIPQNMFSERFSMDLYPPEEKEEIVKRIQNLDIPALPEVFARLKEVVWQVNDVKMFKRIDDTCKDLGIEPLLVNGDLWSANLMWEKKENGEKKLRSVIDFQYFALSSPTVDLVCLFTSCLSGKDRRENTLRLLEIYWNMVRDRFDGPIPFTLEQLVESYERVFPFLAFDVLGIIAYYFGTFPEMIKNRTEAEEKVVFLIEDIITYYKKSIPN